LYTTEDAQQTMKLFRSCRYGELLTIDEGLTIRFTDIGHLLGSAAIECFLTENGEQRKMVFSGDIGNINQPILNDPQSVLSADYLMIEATYGNRMHDRRTDPLPKLVDILNRTFERGGTVIIPSFAVGRTQELLYFFREIKQRNLLPDYSDFPVYVDSPMANEATAVFLQCDISCLDEETRAIMAEGQNPIWFDGLQTITETQESKALNSNQTPKVIIASGGMCEGGRIRHHLKHNIWNANNTILFVGYQSNGTLGRIIYDGAKTVKIYGETIEVKAEIDLLSGVSGHADQAGLLNWVRKFETKPKYIFVNHGDHESCVAFTEKVTSEFNIQTNAPYSGSSFDLIKGNWIKIAEPVYTSKKRSNQAEKKQKKAAKRKNADDTYHSLIQSASKLTAYIKSLEGHSNAELKKLKEQIDQLMKG